MWCRCRWLRLWFVGESDGRGEYSGSGASCGDSFRVNNDFSWAGDFVMLVVAAVVMVVVIMLQ